VNPSTAPGPLNTRLLWAVEAFLCYPGRMNLHGQALDLTRPLLVGILNVTPDSFSDGGTLHGTGAVLRRAQAMVLAGADLLDIGGESTRPGAQEVSEAEELARVLPAIERLATVLTVPLSIDTRRASIARAALLAGAAMVNDVSGFSDPDMADVVANAGAAWVLMHMPHPVGDMPASQRSGAMPADTTAGVRRVLDDLRASLDRAVLAGVPRGQLAVDPGIGFGKTLAQNLALLRAGDAISQARGREAPVDQRLPGTAAAVTAAVLAGAAFVRVHDVAAMRQVLDVATALRDAAVTVDPL
jgi:dihydropteroate synthase